MDGNEIERGERARGFSRGYFGNECHGECQPENDWAVLFNFPALTCGGGAVFLRCQWRVKTFWVCGSWTVGVVEYFIISEIFLTIELVAILFSEGYTMSSSGNFYSNFLVISVRIFAIWNILVFIVFGACSKVIKEHCKFTRKFLLIYCTVCTI